MLRYYRGVMGKPEGKRLLQRSRRRWKNNIEMDLKGIGAYRSHLT